MIDFPKDLTDKAILEKLVAGVVIRRETEFPDGAVSLKRLVVLTNNNDSLVLAVSTTSQDVSNKKYGKDSIFIPKGKECTFNKDTYIQLHRILKIPTKKIKDQYHQHNLDILGNISDEVMDSIYKVISESELLSKRDIERILQDRYTIYNSRN